MKVLFGKVLIRPIFASTESKIIPALTIEKPTENDLTLVGGVVFDIGPDCEFCQIGDEVIFNHGLFIPRHLHPIKMSDGTIERFICIKEENIDAITASAADMEAIEEKEVPDAAEDKTESNKPTA